MRTASVESHAAAFTVNAGAKNITFIFSTDFAGTVAGVAFDGSVDESLDFVAPLNESLGPIAVTVSAGTVRVSKVT